MDPAALKVQVSILITFFFLKKKKKKKKNNKKNKQNYQLFKASIGDGLTLEWATSYERLS
jgi:hypothetical protein